MIRVLDIYTNDGLKLTLSVRLSSHGRPTLFIGIGLGICVSAACEDVTLFAYDDAPNVACLDMPGCSILFNPEFLGDVEALLFEAAEMKSEFLL